MDRDALLAPMCKDAGGVDTSVFDGWEVVPGYIEGEHVCTSVIKGTEIHFHVNAQYRRALILRNRTQGYLEPLLARLGFLTTRVLKESTLQRRFVERIGFKPTWADHRFQFYILGQLPFARSKP